MHCYDGHNVTHCYYIDAAKKAEHWFRLSGAKQILGPKPTIFVLVQYFHIYRRCRYLCYYSMWQ